MTSVAAKELRRLGGLGSTIKMLELQHKKRTIPETAALVLASVTSNNNIMCKNFMLTTCNVKRNKSNDVTTTKEKFKYHITDPELSIDVKKFLATNLQTDDAFSTKKTLVLSLCRLLSNCSSFESTDEQDEELIDIFASTIVENGVIAALALLVNFCIKELTENSASERRGHALSLLNCITFCLGNFACDSLAIREELYSCSALENFLFLFKSESSSIRDNVVHTVLNCVNATGEDKSDNVEEDNGGKATFHLEDVIALLTNGNFPQLLLDLLTEPKYQNEGSPLQLSASLKEALMSIGATCSSKSDAFCRQLVEMKDIKDGIGPFVTMLSSDNLVIQEHSLLILTRCCECVVKDGIQNRVANYIVSSRTLLSLVWMLDHSSNVVQRYAQRCLTAIRISCQAQVLIPMIEQGTVPILHTLSGSKNTLVSEYAVTCLDWLKKQMNGPAAHILIRTLNMQGNEELKGNVGIAFIHLCFSSNETRISFVDGGALGSIISMLSSKDGRSTAVDVLCTLEPLLEAEEMSENEQAVKAANSGSLALSTSTANSDLLSEINFNNPRNSDVSFAVCNQQLSKRDEDQKEKTTTNKNENDTSSSSSVTTEDKSRQIMWTFHGHRSILMKQSSWFQKLAKLSPSQSNFDIKDVDGDAFLQCMRTIYYHYDLYRIIATTGQIGPASENEAKKHLRKLFYYDDASRGGQKLHSYTTLCKYLVAATKLEVTPMILASASYLKDFLRKELDPRADNERVSTIAAIFETACETENKQLCRCCFTFTIENVMPLIRKHDGKDLLERVCKCLSLYLSKAIKNLTAYY
eukprot:g3788.t1